MARPLPRPASLFLLSLLFPSALAAQQPPPQRDPQALTILSQSCAVMGVALGQASVTGSLARGTVTIHGKNQDQQKSIVIKTKGSSKVRYETPEGTNTLVFVINQGNGWYTRGGSIRRVPYAQSQRADIWHMPILSRVVIGGSRILSIEYRGLVPFGVSTAHSIAIIEEPPFGRTRSQPQTNDTILVFVDSHSLLPLAVRYLWVRDDATKTTEVQEYEFSDYQRIATVLVPFTVTHTIEGFVSSQIRFSEIQFNVGILDAEFDAQIKE